MKKILIGVMSQEKIRQRMIAIARGEHTPKITGSNRGIGLELVHQYAAQGWQVLACCRRPDQATALNQLGEQFPGITLHTLDVAQQDQVQKLAARLQERPALVISSP